MKVVFECLSLHFVVVTLCASTTSGLAPDGGKWHVALSAFGARPLPPGRPFQQGETSLNYNFYGHPSYVQDYIYPPPPGPFFYEEQDDMPTFDNMPDPSFVPESQVQVNEEAEDEEDEIPVFERQTYHRGQDEFRRPNPPSTSVRTTTSSLDDTYASHLSTGPSPSQTFYWEPEASPSGPMGSSSFGASPSFEYDEQPSYSDDGLGFSRSDPSTTGGFSHAPPPSFSLDPFEERLDFVDVPEFMGPPARYYSAQPSSTTSSSFSTEVAPAIREDEEEEEEEESEDAAPSFEQHSTSSHDANPNDLRSQAIKTNGVRTPFSRGRQGFDMPKRQSKSTVSYVGRMTTGEHQQSIRPNDLIQ